MRLVASVIGVLTVLLSWPAFSAEFSLNGQRFTLPDGMELQVVASPPLVERPICADFDEQGRLYVAESSGSNDPIEEQLAKKPHRILRLEDTDEDGRFDRRTVFADAMMLPEGTMWYGGSLYVAAPPEIWKLTDTTGDGQADKREVWFDGKTLTHCANDLHGPYRGPDGWFYWCKGAFAEQSYKLAGGGIFVTRAAHIFRRHPRGGPVEPVMTGGMANPVDVVFTAGGERIFSTTFLTRPHAGLRDGLIHAIYGGVYGRANGVLAGHPHTGPLMPVLDHLGAAAPCGLARLESEQLGADFQDNLMTCLFNMQKVTRHVLTSSGASFVSHTEDFLSSDNRDFHPTDVIEDADGSLLVIDTGGWYKLCCPTSQLWKPDIPGAIYRIRRTGSHQIVDPRGKNIDWQKLSTPQLCDLLSNRRIAIRHRASDTLVDQVDTAVPKLRQVLSSSPDVEQRLQTVWTLTKMEGAAARAAVRTALTDADETVRQAALHGAGLWRDALAEAALIQVLRRGSPHNRRAAAEALGRIGSSGSVPALLAAAEGVADRALAHSLIYAAIETSDAEKTRRGLQQDAAGVKVLALVALDQMQNGGLTVDDVIPLLHSNSNQVQNAAWWVVEHHPDWADSLDDIFRTAMRDQTKQSGQIVALIKRLPALAAEPAIQLVMAEAIENPSLASEAHEAVLKAMAAAELDPLPGSWHEPLGRELSAPNEDRVRLALNVLRLPRKSPLPKSIVANLVSIVANSSFNPRLRLQSLVLVPKSDRRLDSDILGLLCQHVAADQAVASRSLSVDVIATSDLTNSQRRAIAESLSVVGPMELRRLVEVLTKSGNEQFGRLLVRQLSRCAAVTSLRPDELQKQLSGFGRAVQPEADSLIARIKKENGELLQKLDAALQLTKSADVRRGQALFHSAKTACSACHAVGYLGGRIGPDLTRIGRIRSERDLLEAILFPSVSFVQNYEPITVVTTQGRMISGTIKEETADEIILQIDAQKVSRVAVDEIEQRLPGTTSIMPSGLDKQLGLQELADLVAFLKSTE